MKSTCLLSNPMYFFLLFLLFYSFFRDFSGENPNFFYFFLLFCTLIVSNKCAEGDVGDAMVVRTATVNVTRFKGAIKIKEGPRATRGFTFQGVN